MGRPRKGEGEKSYSDQSRCIALRRVATGGKHDTLPSMHVPLKTPLLMSVPVFQRQDNYKLQVGLYGKILFQAKQNTTRLPNFPYLQLDMNGVILFVFLRTAFPQQHAILSFTPKSVTKLVYGIT